MRRRLPYILITLLFAASLLNSVFAKAPKNWEQVPVPAINWNPKSHEEFKLPNGIDGLVMTDYEVPLASFHFAFPAPPDPASQVGISDFATWTLRNGGSENIPGDSLNDLTEFKAAYLSFGASDELLWASGSCMAEDLEFLLGLTRELINQPAYPPDKIELRRGQMLESIRRRNDNPRGIAYREFAKLIYPDHPWGRETTIETINSITRDDLLTYHRRVFQPQGAVIGFAGAVSAQTAVELAYREFGDLMGAGELVETLPPAPPAAEPGVYYAYKDLKQSYIILGHQTINYSDPRRYAATIMNYILGGGGFQSVLMKRVRVDEGLAYSVGSSFSLPVISVGRFAASAATRPDQSGRSLKLMDDIIREFQTNGPKEEDFINAKKAYLNSYVWDFESSEGMLAGLVYYKWRGLPLDTPQLDLAAYQALTYAEVKKAAQELLHPDQMIKLIIGDRDKIERPLEEFGTVHVLDISQ
ncbi:MAG: pitrilysin family protein [Calditrichota bacterium]